MWQTFRNIIEDDFIDEEDIVAKNQYLENITIRFPYIPWGNQINLFSSRVAYAIQRLPEEHRKAALVLFANIVYLPKPILDEAWREVAFSLERIFKGKSSLNFSDTLYVSVDNPGLVTIFSHIANLRGREDHDINPGFNTISELIDRLYYWVSNKKRDDDISDILVFTKKKNWVILTDNAISGGSINSDIKKLIRIRAILFPPGLTSGFLAPEIFAAVQLITEQAVASINDGIPFESVAYGIKFDDGFRINSDKCRLFNREETLRAVRSLCEWFGNKYFINQTGLEFRKRLEVHIDKGGREDYAYGWRDCGYTIVTQENALSNSVPVICYSPLPQNNSSNDEQQYSYTSPFPRIESRISHKTSKDKDKLSELETWENTNFIREQIYGKK